METENELYEQDFPAWIEQQTQLLRARAFDELDLERVIEEFECLIHLEQDFVEHHARRVWAYLLTDKYEGFRDEELRDWHRSKAGYDFLMVKSYLKSQAIRQYFQQNYEDIYDEASFNWCCDRGDWDFARLPKEPPIAREDFLRDGENYWLKREREKEN